MSRRASFFSFRDVFFARDRVAFFPGHSSGLKLDKALLVVWNPPLTEPVVDGGFGHVADPC